MAMKETLNSKEITTILIKEAKPLAEGTLINNELISTLPYQVIQESKEVAELMNTCVCHIKGEHRYCVTSEGNDIPQGVLLNENEHISESVRIQPIGELVKNPIVATTLMEEAVFTQVERLENVGIPKDYINQKFDSMVSDIVDVSTRLTEPKVANKARHDAIQIIKRAQLSGPVVAAAVVFASSKISS